MITAGNVTVDSSYDSGTHLGFRVGVKGNCKYTLDNIAKHLTKEQITAVELAVLAAVVALLEGTNEMEGE